MKIYSTLPEQKTGELLRLIGDCRLADSEEEADVVLVVRKDEVEFKADCPEKAVVVAGYPDKPGERFATAAHERGVCADNIFFVPPGGKVNWDFVAGQIKMTGEEEPLYWDEDRTGAVEDEKGNARGCILVAGARGGVGRTTIAVSLLAHYADIGENVCLLDLGSPPSAKFHAGAAEWAEEKFCLFAKTSYGDICRPKIPVWRISEGELSGIIKELGRRYQKVVVDLPAEPYREHYAVFSGARLVAVVDSDVVQSVTPLTSLLNGRPADVYVYNKYRPEVPEDVVAMHIKGDLVTVKEDLQGCYAALASGKPASAESEAVALGVGEIAAKLNGGSEYSWLE